MARKIVRTGQTYSKAIERLHHRDPKVSKSDEYYTPEPAVKAILDKLNPKFIENKIIYCPCDSYESQFVKQIQNYHNVLKYKQLYYTSDDFRSHSDLFDLADIVITNPPFSQSKEFVHNLISHNCDFVIISMLASAGPICVKNKLKCFRLNLPRTPENKQIPMFICPEKDNHFSYSDGKFLSCCDTPYDIMLNTFDLIKPEFIDNYLQDPKKITLLKDYEDNFEFCENYEYNGNKVLNINNINDVPLDYNGYFCLPCTSIAAKNRIVDNIDFLFRISPDPIIKGKIKFLRILCKWKDFDKNKDYFKDINKLKN